MTSSNIKTLEKGEPERKLGAPPILGAPFGGESSATGIDNTEGISFDDDDGLEADQDENDEEAYF